MLVGVVAMLVRRRVQGVDRRVRRARHLRSAHADVVVQPQRVQRLPQRSRGQTARMVGPVGPVELQTVLSKSPVGIEERTLDEEEVRRDPGGTGQHALHRFEIRQARQYVAHRDEPNRVLGPVDPRDVAYHTIVSEAARQRHFTWIGVHPKTVRPA